VQGQLEKALSLYFKKEIAITGCGRTDTGVHAVDYIAHLDLAASPNDDFLFTINKIIDGAVSITDIYAVPDEAHARYHAVERSYIYRLSYEKNPFLYPICYRYPYGQKLDLELLNQAAAIILEGKDFTAFAKVGTDVKTNLCTIKECKWKSTESGLTFHVTANRFLRGMVRLIVGSSINYALNKLSKNDLRAAVIEQKPLPLIWSVPGEGLSLCRITYPLELEKPIPA
jgi:tRNA pseudouridine38-40 synthase